MEKTSWSNWKLYKVIFFSSCSGHMDSPVFFLLYQTGPVSVWSCGSTWGLVLAFCFGVFKTVAPTINCTDSLLFEALNCFSSVLGIFSSLRFSLFWNLYKNFSSGKLTAAKASGTVMLTVSSGRSGWDWKLPGCWRSSSAGCVGSSSPLVASSSRRWLCRSPPLLPWHPPLSNFTKVVHEGENDTASSRAVTLKIITVYTSRCWSIKARWCEPEVVQFIVTSSADGGLA